MSAWNNASFGVVSSLVVLGLVLGPSVPALAQGAFPARLDTYFTSVLKLSPEERANLLSGEVVTRHLDGDPSKEVGVFGATWISAPVDRYVALARDIENFEKGTGFRATTKVSSPAKIADFAKLELSKEDVDDLRSCEVGDCELKLGADALARMRKEVDWSRPDAKAQAEALMRRLAVEYVDAYRQGGNSRLAVYRDAKQPTFVADEFRGLVEGTPELVLYLPDLRRYLLEFPTRATRPTTSFIYWQEVQFGLKPTIRISHVAIQESTEGTIVASKQLYSSHYFWTALELRVLVRDPSRGPGFWFVNINRSRSDGLTGFTGRVVRGKAREGAINGMRAALTSVKRKLEQ